MKRDRQDPHQRPPPMPLFNQHPYGTGQPCLPPDPAAVAALSEELQYRYHERAAILEYDGGLPREQAEAQAWEFLSNAIRREKGGLPPREPGEKPARPS